MKKRYWITILTLFLLRFADLFLTWIYTPDLNEEYNPIVSLFGHSWAGLIGTQIVFLIVVALFGAYTFFKPAQEVTQKGLVFGDFIYCYFFHELKPWHKRFFSIPKDLHAHMIFNGFMFISVALLISLFAIVNNSLLILGINSYELFLVENYDTFFPTVFFIITAISFFLFFGIQYRIYTQSTSSEVPISVEPQEKTPCFEGEVSSELVTFLYENEETVFKLQLTFDMYQSLDVIEWIEGGSSEAINWFPIEHDNGGTELGLFHNDPHLFINTRDKRAISISGMFQVESLQGPKDGWVSLTVKGVK